VTVSAVVTAAAKLWVRVRVRVRVRVTMCAGVKLSYGHEEGQAGFG
jgi:hypothetical protein